MTLLVAVFNEATDLSGKNITYDEVQDQFVLQDHGPITARGVLDYDAQDQIEWAQEGLWDWVCVYAEWERTSQLPSRPAIWPLVLYGVVAAGAVALLLWARNASSLQHALTTGTMLDPGQAQLLEAVCIGVIIGAVVGFAIQIVATPRPCRPRSLPAHRKPALQLPPLKSPTSKPLPTFLSPCGNSWT